MAPSTLTAMTEWVAVYRVRHRSGGLPQSPDPLSRFARRLTHRVADDHPRLARQALFHLPDGVGAVWKAASTSGTGGRDGGRW